MSWVVLQKFSSSLHLKKSICYAKIGKKWNEFPSKGIANKEIFQNVELDEKSLFLDKP